MADAASASPWRARLARIVPPLVLVAALILLWAYAAARSPLPYLFPGPLKVWQAIVDLAASGQLGDALLVTMRRLFLGFIIAIVAGLVLALVMASHPWAHAALHPLLLGLQSLPGLAWVPLALLWFGFTETALLFVTIIGSVWAVALAFSDGLATVPPLYFRAARNLGAKGATIITHVGLPAALPVIVGGAKQSWAFAWRSLVGAEIVFATVGLGFLLTQGREFLQVAQVMAVMVATLTVGVATELLVFGRLDAWVRRRWGLGRTRAAATTPERMAA